MALNPDLFTTLYKPDVLMCLADLSNDEVFTPPDIANQVLDMLPQKLFRDPNTKFLDPALKSGVFLREIAKRLIAGLADKIPNLQDRCDHIFKNQLYGIAITELTSLLGRRSVYCSKYPNSPFSITKFDNVQGNNMYRKMRHRWDHAGSNGKCIFCGTAYDGDLGDLNREGLETHAYEFIHTLHPEEIFSMKFDVICSNPPYQLSDGGNNASAMPIYQKFVEQAKKLNPRYITMIIPSRWYSGGRGLENFRSTMINDLRIRKLVDYTNSSECFPGVDISGGICYFLWERDYEGACEVTNIENGTSNSMMRPLNQFPVLIRDNCAVNILQKVIAKNEPLLKDRVSGQRPFGLRTFARPQETGELMLRWNGGVGPFNVNDVPAGHDMIDEWKVIVSRVFYEHGGQTDKNGQRRVLSILETLKPKEICTETYIVVDHSSSEKHAKNLKAYLSTNFVRFLILQASSSIMISKNSFMFVPIKDMSRTWTDNELFDEYRLTEKEREYINSVIRPM